MKGFSTTKKVLVIVFFILWFTAQVYVPFVANDMVLKRWAGPDTPRALFDMDFWGYVIPGYMWLDGNHDIYDHNQIVPYFEKVGFKSPVPGVICYPPSFYTLMIPFAVMPPEQATDTWLLLKYFSFLWIGVLLTYMAGGAEITGTQRMLLVLLILSAIYSTKPVMDDIAVGQVNIHVFFLLLMALFFISKDKDIPGGICLGLVFSIKLISIFLIIYYAYRRRWKIVIPAIGIITILWGLSIIAFGPGIIADFVDSLTGSFVQVNYFGNLSIQYRLMFLIDRNPQLVKSIYTAIALLIIAGAGFRLASLKDEANPHYVFSLLMVTATITSPVVWSHHHVWFFLFLTLWAKDLYIHPLNKPVEIFNGILFLIVYFIMAFLNGLFSQYYYYYEVFHWGIPFGMQMAVWLAVMFYPPGRLIPGNGSNTLLIAQEGGCSSQ